MKHRRARLGVALLVYYSGLASPFIVMNWNSTGHSGFKVVLWTLTTILAIYIPIGMYVRDMVQTQLIPASDRRFWYVFLFFVSFVSMPLYFLRWGLVVPESFRNDA